MKGRQAVKEAVKEAVKRCFKKLDYLILLIMTILIGIGVYCSRQAFIGSDDYKSIFIKQLAGVFIGYVFIIVIIFIDYHIICNLSALLYIAMNLLLAVTLLFGSGVNNVNRWIIIFGIPFQPSELTKVVLILFLAFLCNHFKDKLNKLYVLFLLFIAAAIPMALIVLEPHLSSGLSILFIFIVMVYSSGISYKVIGKALALVVPLAAVILASVYLFKIDIPFIKQYQVNRVLSFLSSEESDSQDGDYQQLQSIGAIGSGGLHGKMISSEKDKDRAYSRIYAKESDFVFAIVGEEFGFIGGFFIILLYVVLIIKCLIISSHAPDYTGKLIGIGVSAYLMFQIFMNIGVATKLLPNTGLPLPFISYGLTSLISSMAAVGLVLNIGIRQKSKSTDTIKLPI